MAESIDEYFTATSRHWLIGPADLLGVLQGCRRNLVWSFSTPSSAAAISILLRAGCGRRARASTRSARPGTRATRRSPPRCGHRPRLLHYRSGGFFLARGRAVPERSAARRAARPGRRGRGADLRRAAQGFGRHDLAVIPQTSTIASHLPRAVGVAFAIGAPRSSGCRMPLARRRDRGVQLRRRLGEPRHRRRRHQRGAAGRVPGAAVPLLFVCEDNGIGISVQTPGLGRAAYASREARVLQRRRLRPRRRFHAAAAAAD